MPAQIPVEQLRALVRLLYPEHMTPIAKRQIESVCEQADDGGREQPPMPVRAEVSLAVREDGRGGQPVVVLNLVDVMGETRQLHVGEDLAMELMGDLAVAVRQLHRGQHQMPAPWLPHPRHDRALCSKTDGCLCTCPDCRDH